ncbi:radical SAM/SPASM domain-containing protein [Clostridium saccharobutylicum]|uniref:Radical SAM domain protein n=1 Tax=Clostridium saccharobutylicum DSM 13864 TaxID=1345695 RepID=U5MTC6_CLOSA|nr:radical SAM protein [Clostridium saccharobutylicum]AGX43850.1 radical SAM domain protein [Clostridium saccharobutylicum DSM 13864]AQR91149.1 cyclic pyranopterin monophosphate synthase [Clostridium saccharobutylicum]AQS01053.1 cyclic pyranopterin monophosphate synthase [Clostridium saccharobutylicum]AQS15036.1 cyclic pyranopterin monophosphate synthase [Clostridium saccharobutylicum]MBA2905160.1 radical SAM protein with 4Fe4S-binding SPASM domain [Clostridium saccharobutylicum]
MKKFKKVYIEITNVCNLSCNFCPKTSRKLEFMDRNSFQHIIKNIKPYTDHIYLHLMGEPFLNKELEQFLDISRENQLRVNITTNGTLIENVKDILLKAPALRQVNISLHSFEANEENVDFDVYIENIINFVREATEKTEIICSLRLWNLDTKYTANNDMNVDIFKLLEEKFELKEDLKKILKEKNSFKLKKNLYLSMGEKFMWPSLTVEELGERAFCYGLRDQIGVLVDGTVVPCCLDSEGSIKLGNIFKQDLEEILNSKRAKDIYDGFSGRKAVEDLCKRCGFINRVR